MAHGAHRHVDIATQAGVSVATVDRVLHARPGVSARAVRAVERALLDLDRQQHQLRLGARSLVVDLVIQAPDRFSSQVQDALEAALPTLHPATVRARVHRRESGDLRDLIAHLDSVGTRGRSSDGVLLKAPDQPEVIDAVERLADRGIPVVTLVTDVRASRRLAYVGPDNTAAGATAGYLLEQWLGSRQGCALVTLSRTAFFGERERLEGFRQVLAQRPRARDVVVLADADGLDEGMTGLVRAVVAQRRDIAAVYSAGGGNRGIARVLSEAGLAPIHLGHDLDDDNLELLRSGRLHAVLHHDLRADARRACQQLLRSHGLLPGAPTSYSASVEVVTPHNIPRRMQR